MTYFCPALDPPLDGSGQKTTTFVKDHEHFIPTKFGKYPLSGSVVKADYVFPYIYNVHALVHPPPLFHLNKYIKNSFKFLKHLNLLYKHSSHLQTWKLHKINVV